MSKEKQIEEMIDALKKCSCVYTDCEQECAQCSNEELYDDTLNHIARTLYEAGYRKQSEGEWIAEKSITESKRGRTIHSTVYRCSLCDAPNGRKKDHFCRWCGASMVASMMKGGVQE